MIYKEFQELELSALGMGCMRLPVVDGKDDQIDQKAVEEMAALAMERGVNYYDTAWGYHGGQSEPAMGRALRELAAPHAAQDIYENLVKLMK